MCAKVASRAGAWIETTRGRLRIRVKHGHKAIRAGCPRRFTLPDAGAPRPRPGTRTALYLRVSTADQKPDLQYDGLRGYAARAGLDVVQDYCDVAGSGRREGRPQLNALMVAARNQEIDCVLVWKFDRFARSTRHLLTALEKFDHSRRALRQRPGPGGHRQPNGPGHVHHHRRHGRTGVVAHQRARDRRYESG